MYCCFYFRYTSVGTKKNTFKNKALRQSDGLFAHASTLSDWSLERVRE